MITVNLKSLLGLAALGVTLLANTVPTWAGAVGASEVYAGCDTKRKECEGRGSMVGARYSADNKQFIGCSIRAGSDASLSITCSAKSSAGKTAVCMSTDPGYVDQVQRMTDSSFIVFTENYATGACTELLIFDSSSDLK